MAGLKPKASERNIPSTPIPTKTSQEKARKGIIEDIKTWRLSLELGQVSLSLRRPASRDHTADMPKLDPQSHPLLSFEIQSMTVSVESSAGTTRTSSETPDDSALALIAREGEPVSININLVCRFARRTRE
ncbi:predicted protein [Aspergillus nidulans FGSC A4]|uniref:Uncharacterized protein n=1 Tax=Emericella nidulans (strain FGSC A4 / ATCC 38163 / CBS 112.46 / NRRL 194 / M139) TaxID=227321 RepID=Q5AVR8_EMENI|nr:hypothetical protein [Aspergillus nidulans FGSC A4]EAA61798.1 predicted protein [Aspergillus nidulans FGSC A4]CBF79743.1 TPA: hypothetical protein ANIA_07612 [Aspergillus nidulans FGSC A4]|eukprot:XP_680881.1 predicted protein [Aspergillus nidulans FGSC A4]